MTDTTKKIGWLPSKDEFGAMVETAPSSPEGSIMIISDQPLVLYTTDSFKQLFKASKDSFLNRYEFFRNLILKMERSAYTFRSFLVKANDASVGSSLIYIRGHNGPHTRSNFERSDGLDWFTSDLIYELERLTRGVPDEAPSGVVDHGVLAREERTPKPSGNVLLSALSDVESKPENKSCWVVPGSDRYHEAVSKSSMTYEELGQHIAALSPEQLKQEVTIFVSGVNEYYTLDQTYPALESQEDDVLDKGHPYLKI